MNTRYQSLALIALVCYSLAFVSADALARGGRGGGGGGGRGGGGVGGGYGGGARMSAAPRAAPSYAANRSPSMSRAAAPSARPAAPSRSAGAGSVAGARAGQGQRALSATGSAPGVGSRSPYSRPSSNQVSSFLNLPSGAPKAGAFNAPSQLPGGGQSRTYTTAGGGTITVGGTGGSRTTAGGGTVGAGVGGIKVETAGGGEYGKVGAGVGGTGPGGSAVAGRSVSGFRGAGGAEGAKISGGAASSSGYRQGGGISAVQGRGGYTAVNVRGGYGAGGTGRIGSATAVVGPGGNVVSAGRGASFVNGQFVGGQAWRGVNGAFNHWGWYGGAGWWAGYPGAWFPGKWAIATTAWATAAWATAGAYCGCDSGSASYYDYGQNVAYGDDGMVYTDGQPAATAAEYYDQAAQIADSGQTPQNEDWLPLGIFAVITAEDQTQADKVVQLALNKEGVIRGNYHDLLADKMTPVAGAVDKQTQRVALRIEGNKELLVETGLYNLTNDEAPVLVHFGPDRQEPRIFVRLQQPESEGAAAKGAAQ